MVHRATQRVADAPPIACPRLGIIERRAHPWHRRSSTDDGETLWIVDGLHRLDAHRKAQRAASPKVKSIRASDDDNPA
jgi:hypothetical protein